MTTPQPDPLRELATQLESREGKLPPRPTQYRRGWAAASKDAANRIRAALPVQDEPGLETGTCWFCKGRFVIDALIAGYDTFDEQRLACLACNERMDGNWRPLRAAPARLRDYPDGHPGDIDRADCDCDCHIPGEDMDPADCDHCTGMSEQERVTPFRLGAADGEPTP